jgi:hypothetical protein
VLLVLLAQQVQLELQVKLVQRVFQGQQALEVQPAQLASGLLVPQAQLAQQV